MSSSSWFKGRSATTKKALLHAAVPLLQMAAESSEGHFLMITGCAGINGGRWFLSRDLEVSLVYRQLWSFGTLGLLFVFIGLRIICTKSDHHSAHLMWFGRELYMFIAQPQRYSKTPGLEFKMTVCFSFIHLNYDYMKKGSYYFNQYLICCVTFWHLLPFYCAFSLPQQGFYDATHKIIIQRRSQISFKH